MNISPWIGALASMIFATWSALSLRRHVEALGAPLTLTRRQAARLSAVVLAPLVVALSFVCHWQAHSAFGGVASTFLVASLLVLAWIDAETMVLPDRLTIPLTVAGLLINWHGVLVPAHDALIGAIVGFLLPWVNLKGYALITKTDGLGLGDVKLFAALGAWLGWLALPGVFFVALAVQCTLALGLYAIGFQSRTSIWKTPLPFGPAIAFAGIIATIFQWPQLV